MHAGCKLIGPCDICRFSMRSSAVLYLSGLDEGTVIHGVHGSKNGETERREVMNQPVARQGEARRGVIICVSSSFFLRTK